jgi:hypothetical protein
MFDMKHTFMIFFVNLFFILFSFYLKLGHFVKLYNDCRVLVKSIQPRSSQQQIQMIEIFVQAMQIPCNGNACNRNGQQDEDQGSQS